MSEDLPQQVAANAPAMMSFQQIKRGDLGLAVFEGGVRKAADFIIHEGDEHHIARRQQLAPMRFASRDRGAAIAVTENRAVGFQM